MNDYGKPQNDKTQQDDQTYELVEQLNLLETVDRRITSEHVARRFRELLDDVGNGLTAHEAPREDRPAEGKLGVARAQAAEIVADARREAAAWLAKAERAANEAAVATRRARTIMADADAYADAQRQHVERMIADARRQAEEIVADAKQNAEQITSIPHATGEPSTLATTDAEELTAAAKLHIVLLPAQDNETQGTVPVDQTHRSR